MKLKLWMPVLVTACSAIVLAPASARAADGTVTYHEHVAPILKANCVTCHQPAGNNIGSLVAPMSLMTYEEARPWARAIARKVKAREMPPWFSDAPKGVLHVVQAVSRIEIAFMDLPGIERQLAQDDVLSGDGISNDNNLPN